MKAKKTVIHVVPCKRHGSHRWKRVSDCLEELAKQEMDRLCPEPKTVIRIGVLNRPDGSPDFYCYADSGRNRKGTVLWRCMD